MKKRTEARRGLCAWFGDLQFKNKLFLSYVVVIVIPVLVLGLFSFTQARDSLLRQSRQSFADTASLISGDIDSRLDKYCTMLDFMRFNRQVLNAIDIEGKTAIDAYIDYSDNIEALFNTAVGLNTEIRSLAVYTTNEVVYEREGPVRAMREIAEEPWLAPVLADYAIHWTIDEAGARGVGRLSKPAESVPDNVLCITIDLDCLFTVNTEDINDFGFISYGWKRRDTLQARREAACGCGGSRALAGRAAAGRCCMERRAIYAYEPFYRRNGLDVPLIQACGRYTA